MDYAIKDVASYLNSLVQICRDGEKGFEWAAQNVQDAQLRTLFRDLAAQRGQFAVELENEVVRLGEVPETEGSMMGALHRGWLNLKNAVAGNDDAAIISEAERGEDAAVDAYRDNLEKAMPESTRALVARQYSFVQAAHDRVRAIELAHQS
jgi:uncharacterized protein (TIGR02284 family)